MKSKKLKLVLSYDIQDMEGNSQISEIHHNACETELPNEDLSKINYKVILTSIGTVLQYLRLQAYHDKGFDFENRPLFSKETSRKVSLHLPVEPVRIRRYQSRIQETENSHNECPLTQCPFEYYNLDISNLPETHKSYDSIIDWNSKILR
jgi:hypothetical protein